MDLSPAQYEQLAAIAARAARAGYGKKTAVYQRGAAQLGISVPTLLKRLRQVRHAAPRKRRRDAGHHALTRAEALLIAGTVNETRRETDTGALSLERAVAILRSNGLIQAGSVDAATGEFAPLSLSAIRRAMAHHNCHPSQLHRPTAALTLATEHPNHVWQIDASVSRQFYLADEGTRVMDASIYYRGKPKNFIKINDRRLIRYCVADHCSGHIRVFYVQGSESSLGVISALIHAMTPAEGIAMHGVPRALWMDKGSLSQAVQAFCDTLSVHIEAHAAGNPRALGAGEQAHNLIEQSFEAPLKLRKPVASIEEMNAEAAVWCRHYNATAMHTRTRMTRRDGWLRITPAQLVTAPPADVLRQLANDKPTTCTVRDLYIRYRSHKWDLRGMPGVLNGSKVEVLRNAFDADTVRVVTTDDAGHRAYYLAPRFELNEWGFPEHATTAGEFAAMPAETPADATRREIERLVMEAATDEEAAAKRKAKALPFGGGVDPTKPWRDTEIVPHLPRAATPSAVAAPAEVAPVPQLPRIEPAYEPQRFTHVQMARDLKRRIEALGGAWTAELYARMAATWPQGVLEQELEACATQLLRGELRVVGGAA